MLKVVAVVPWHTAYLFVYVGVLYQQWADFRWENCGQEMSVSRTHHYSSPTTNQQQ